MSEMTERLDRMERQVRVLRRWVVSLGAILVGCVTLGVAGSQELALRRLAIVDDSGAERIVMLTVNGHATIMHYDRDGKMRIATGTAGDGQPTTQYYDRDGKMRIATTITSDGTAGILHFARDGKKRIMTMTVDDGPAGIVLQNSKGENVWNELSE